MTKSEEIKGLYCLEGGCELSSFLIFKEKYAGRFDMMDKIGLLRASNRKEKLPFKTPFYILGSEQHEKESIVLKILTLDGVLGYCFPYIDFFNQYVKKI